LFAACKSGHYDDRGGHHLDWQLLVDDPARFAEYDAAAKACAASGDSSCDSIGENMTEAGG